ncbi:hypothetical protein ACFWRG_03295 [Micromonospora tulbaghiae]
MREPFEFSVDPADLLDEEAPRRNGVTSAKWSRSCRRALRDEPG